MVRSAEIITINQDEIWDAVKNMNEKPWHSHADDEKGSKLYIPSLVKVINHKSIVSAIARTSNKIMKTEVLIKEPYTITMMMKQFNIVPIPQTVRVVINMNDEYKGPRWVVTLELLSLLLLKAILSKLVVLSILISKQVQFVAPFVWYSWVDYNIIILLTGVVDVDMVA